MARVRLDRLAHNVRVLQARLAPGVRMMASVKADAYGHGAVAVSYAALAAGVDQLGVATLEEALELRDAGITADILVYGALSGDAWVSAIRANVQVTIFDTPGLAGLTQAVCQTGISARAHVKVDTGMTRLGVRGTEAAVALLLQVAAAKDVTLAGVYTHFACADEPLTVAQSVTEAQRLAFDRVLTQARAAGVRIPLAHAANSAALLRGSQFHYDLVRPGIALYGYHPAPGWGSDEGLSPVLALTTQVVRVADVAAGTGVSYGHTYVAPQAERIATLPIGYADGIPRAWSGRGSLLVKGAGAPIAGRVCMDQTMIRCGDTAVEVGDRVIIYGEAGWGPGSLERAAKELETIPYELLCAISRRVPRVYAGVPE